MIYAKRFFVLFFYFIVIICLSCSSSSGPDWPVYNADNSRSGVTAAEIDFPLTEIWRWIPPSPPSPAWPDPAGQDYYHNIRTITPEMDFDRANHVVVSGGLVYFGSSSDDRIRALDAKTGRERWSFITEGPVRLAPTVSGGKLYAGSDDGFLYCLDAKDGDLMWNTCVSGENRRLPGNERIISLHPVRSAVVVEGDTAWCAAGVFPAYGACLCAVNSRSGEVILRKSIDISPQGYMAASPLRLFVPTGRTQPAIYSRAAGDLLGQLNGPGGGFLIVTDSGVVNAPGRREGEVSVSGDGESIVRFKGIRMVMKDGISYILSRECLTAVDRIAYTGLTRKLTELDAARKKLEGSADDMSVSESDHALKLSMILSSIDSLSTEREKCTLWERDCVGSFSLIMAGSTLLVGGADKVVAFSAADGEHLESSVVEGNAYSLAVAENRLYVSTDKGVIHCFGAEKKKQPDIIRPATPRPDDSQDAIIYEEAAEHILSETGMMKGYCFDIGCDDGRLACALAARSDLSIICITGDEKTANRARKTIDNAGLYGRVCVQIARLSDLPYIHYVANLVVSEKTLLSGKLPSTPENISRLLRPSGGTVCFICNKGTLNGTEAWTGESSVIDWAKSGDGVMVTGRRRSLPGSGEWVQLYADASNTSCSRDELTGPLRLQWFGRPGPRHMVDRHHRAASPLSGGGRLFFPGNDRIYALDSYNGTLLWMREFPGSRRVGALKDSGNLVLSGEELLYAKSDSCLVLDAATGNVTGCYIAAGYTGDSKAEWGYLSAVDGHVIGTSQKQGASFRDLDFWGSPVNGSFLQERDYKDVIVSRSLFALDRRTGETVWTHHGGSIMNNTVAIGDGRVFFCGTSDPEIARDDGRVRIDRFCERGLYIASLDLATGVMRWKKSCSFPFHHIMFLCYSDDIALVTGTFNEEELLHYGLFAFDASTGKELWRTRYIAMNIRGTGYAPLNGDHGEQWQHPVICDGTVYLRPYAFDLRTGAKKDYISFRGGHGCGGMTGSAYFLFGRGSTPRMYPTDVDETDGIELTTVSRPGCWLNMIPAGGLVMIPESSSGCTCGYSVQTSMAFSMVEKDMVP